MLRHYFKLALRSFRKQSGFTLINIFGLATGMAACLLLLQYIGFEMSFDHFHSKADRIYRVVNERYQNGELVQRGTITYPTIGPTLKEDYPEVRNATRFFYGGSGIARIDDQVHRVEQPYFVDEHFLEVFDFSLLAIAKDSVLALPNQLMLTREQADAWFSVKNGQYDHLLGKTVLIDNAADPYTIVGVLDDVPANSLLQFDMLLSYASAIRYFGENADNSWTWSDFYHFVELEPAADVAVLETKLPEFSEHYFRGDEVSGSDEVFYLQPLLEAHLQSTDLEYEMGQTKNGKAIWSLLLLAFFILVIAWINYANLTSSRALERAREVGLRKIAGARPRQLIGQFLTEAFLANILSLAVALGLVAAIHPWFYSQMGVDLGRVGLIDSLAIHPQIWITGLVLWIGGILLSAFYPAWVLSSQGMSEILKGQLKRGRKGVSLRNSLIVFQFAASIALIAGTFLVYQQISYLQQQDLGVNIDQIVVLEAPELANWDSTFIDRMDLFKQKLMENPSIKSATTSSRVPGEGMGRIFELRREGDPDNRNHTFNFIMVDHQYAATYDLEPIAGRYFRRDDHSPNWDDLHNIVVNEAGVEELGFATAEEAIGQVIDIYGKQWTIVGVVPDYHQLSLHHPIEPMVLQPAYGTYNPISVRIDGQDVGSTITQIKRSFDDFFPGNAFAYTFLNETFQQQYEADGQFNQLLLFFTALAIIIACLGLFGLASYATFLRTKEIGVRKILGASVQELVVLLSKDFVILVGIAVIIGLPLSWYGVRFWLQNFAYQAPLPWWGFVLAAVAGLLVAFGTVCYHALRAAYVNPADSLRTE